MTLRFLVGFGVLWAVLAGLADPADVAMTVAGWLASPPAGLDRHRLDPLLPSLYPVPRWGLSDEPLALQRVLSGHVGSVDAVVARLREYESAGCDRIMLQHLLHTDLEPVRLIGRELAPALA